MSRNVEVLREMRAECERSAAAVRTPNEELQQCAEHRREQARALSAVISALEEKEAPRKAVPHQHADGARCASADVCPQFNPDAQPKSSSDSMEERIRELEIAIRTEGGDIRRNTLAWNQAAILDAVARLTLVTGTHQSWCRGDHSEGACVSDPGDIAP